MRKQILIVEDQPVIALNIQYSLIAFGYEVIDILATGEEVQQVVELHHPALILMDIKLADEMDGIEAAEQVKAKYDIPIIFLTGHSDISFIEQVKRINPAGYILKPFDERQLYCSIEIALETHQIKADIKKAIVDEKPKPHSILLVDDDEYILKGLAIYLTDSDYHVHQAKNGKEGLTVFNQQKPDIVITDLIMPEMNGLELIKIIAKESPETPVIVISGINNVDKAIESMKQGAWDFVTKPIAKLSILEHSLITNWKKALLLRQNRQYQFHLEDLVKQRTITLQQNNLNLIDEIVIRKKTEEKLNQSLIQKQKAYDDLETALTALQKSEERYIIASRIGKTAVWEILPAKRKILFDHSFSELLDYKLDDLTDNLEDWYKLVHPKDQAKTRDAINGLLERNSNYYVIEHRFFRKDGSIVWFFSNGKIVNENPLCLIGSSTDITDKKGIEKELENYRLHLEKLVQKRTLELTKANEKLQNLVDKEQELSRMKDEFTGNINHELKTPLTSIMMTIDYLQSKLEQLCKDKIRDKLTRLNKASIKLLNLVNELLDFSRMEAGKLDCQLSRICLFDILDTIRDSFDDICRQRGLQLSLVCPKDITVNMDYNHLYKIINNLIHNACKFSHQGKIDINAFLNNDFVDISITDTGCGISQDHFQLIFSRFKQVYSQERKTPGTGIGLHMVKELTEKHGGNVLVNSKIGKGSIFTIQLPVCSQWDLIVKGRKA